jgi:hypothetical protein
MENANDPIIRQKRALLMGLNFGYSSAASFMGIGLFFGFFAGAFIGI